jgi:hypothetical protein
MINLLDDPRNVFSVSARTPSFSRAFCCPCSVFDRLTPVFLQKA